MQISCPSSTLPLWVITLFSEKEEFFDIGDRAW